MAKHKNKKNRNRGPKDVNVEKPDSNSTEETPEKAPETDNNAKKGIPAIHDKKGKLLKLKRSEFPYSRTGIIAYCDYRIETWQLRKQEMLKKADPMAKKKTKLAKLQEQAKELEAEIENAS